MKPIFLGAAIGALLAVPFAAQAQQAAHAPDPADPQAAVPAIAYRSALTGAAHPPAPAATPDQLWRQANASVAPAPGHAGHAGHAEHAQPVQPAQPAQPAAAAGHAHGKPDAPAPAHGKHH